MKEFDLFLNHTDSRSDQQLIASPVLSPTLSGHLFVGRFAVILHLLKK